MAGAETTNHRCGYCGQENSRFCYSVRSIYGEVFSIRRCLRCGAFFLTPRPSAEQLGRYYEQECYGAESGKFSPAVEKVLDFFRWRRELLFEFLKGNHSYTAHYPVILTFAASADFCCGE